LAQVKKIKKSPEAQATLANLYRIFTVPESADSTLIKIENHISHNLMDFLKEHIVASEIPPSDIERIFSDTTIPANPMYVSDQAEFLLTKVVAQTLLAIWSWATRLARRVPTCYRLVI
jgi:glutamate decarboxylase